MGNDCTKGNENIYFKCRKEAATWDKRLYSRESAAELLGVSVSSLADYELGNTKVVPVDKVNMMADLYRAPQLKTMYCKHDCPIGECLTVATEIKSMKGKGIDFAIDRFVCHLQRHYRKYGCEGYVLTFDFSKYFDRINHERLKAIVDECYTDKRLSSLIKQLIDDFGGEAGLGLGSQISQVSALMYPNILDHFIKESLRIKGYARYMDDGYAIHPDKSYLRQCLKGISAVSTTSKTNLRR